MSLRQKQVSFDNIWPTLEHDFVAIYRHEDLDGISAMDMFNNIYDLCVAKPEPHTEKLLKSIEKFMQNHTGVTLQTIVQSNNILATYANEWQKYQQASGWIHQVCGYLNKILLSAKTDPSEATTYYSYYIQNKITIEALALFTWKTTIIDTIKLKHNNALMKAVFETIRRDREGDEYTEDFIKSVVLSLVILDKYTLDVPRKSYLDDFEASFIAQTREFYLKQSQILISNNIISEYLEKVKRILAQEVLRCSRFCDESSIDKIIQECEYELIAKHSSVIYPQFESSVKNDDIYVMGLNYDLLSKLPNGIQPLVDTFERIIRNAVREELKSAIESKELHAVVNCLLKQLQKYLDVAEKAFRSCPQFIAAIDKGMRSVINESHASSVGIPEILAKYCDVLLRRSQSITKQPNSADGQISSVLTLFKYVDDKDVFQKLYSKYLAKRLIFGLTTSMDLEGSIIGRLKNVCGLEYTSKLQRMYQDIGISNDLTREYSLKATSPPIQAHFLVLTAGAWPILHNTQGEFVFPHSLEQALTQFQKFYHDKHNGRKLTWVHSLSRVDMKCHGLDKRYEINTSLYQAAILQLIMEHDSVSIADIQISLKLQISDLERSLKGLLDVDLLTSDGRVVSLNPRFTNKKIRLRLQNTYAVEQVQESETARKEVDEDRKLYLQAVIVRIMKSRKTLSHNHLIEEVVNLSNDRFKPSITIMKKCIEQLIDKQYIGRSEHSDDYVYLA